MPRPRFTLRVVLAVTVIVALLAWQGGLVYQRRATIERMRARGVHTHLGNAAVDLQARLNPIRKLMGDESVRILYVPNDLPQDEVASFSTLFPEAIIKKTQPRPRSSPEEQGPIASP